MQSAELDRYNYIDFLKVIGLTGIILAHVGSPKWIMMVRSFDVPLMVILSSILAEKSYRKYGGGNGIISAKQYCIYRFKRLVIPTWIFLTVFFSINILVSGHFYSMKYYIASYCLTRYGIGYVWIILIYLYNALLIPFFTKLQLSSKGMIVVAAAYFAYELACYFQIGTNNKFLDTTVFYIIPYGVLTYLGYNYNRFNSITKSLITIISLFIFAIAAFYYWSDYGSPQPVRIAKYPPRLYYLSYGVFCSFLLLNIKKLSMTNLKNKHSLIRYISTHSMWIYLWHILALSAYSLLHLPEIWFIKFIVVYCLALFAVLLINTVLDDYSYNIRTAFL